MEPQRTQDKTNITAVSGFAADETPSLNIHVLASGSKGNAAIIENVHTHKALAVDCGICKRAFFEGCAEVGVSLDAIEGILITHEHTDHTKGLGVVTRGLTAKGFLPRIFAGKKTSASSNELRLLRDTIELHHFTDDESFSLAGIHVQAFATSHDTVESFGFRFSVENDAIGYMTDSGMVTPEAYEALQGCRVLALESNHDSRMLETGPYPAMLKRRVASNKGHLSNAQAAEALEKLMSSKLERVIAMHISENNNTYRLPRESFEKTLEQHDHPAEALAAFQQRVVSS